MKQKLTRILAILCGVLLLGLLVWRLWPRSLASISGSEFDKTVSFSVQTRTWRFEDGRPIRETHLLEAEDTIPGSEHFAPVLEQFKAIKARPSFGNLLRPWLLNGVSYGGSADHVDVFVSFGDSTAFFSLTSKGELVIHNSAHLYFLTSDEPFDALWEYVTTHGAENNS